MRCTIICAFASCSQVYNRSASNIPLLMVLALLQGMTGDGLHIMSCAYGLYINFIASPTGMSFGELNHVGKGSSLSGMIFGFESQDRFEKAFVLGSQSIPT